MTRRPNTEAREKILQTAYELFATRGYEAVSMDRVAQVAGLKKPNLFHYYKTKELLGAAVIEHAARRHVADMQSILEDSRRDPVSVVEALFDQISVDCSRGCFIGKMGQEIDHNNEEMRHRLSSCLMQWRSEVATFFGTWQKKGYFRRGFDVVELADDVLSLYEGSLLMSKMIGDRSPVRHARRAAVTVLISWKG
jgi:TetR/AcrR family transcriptional repressor of nem operon